jgi:RNA polymerase sigma-70 factor (ECF subfamily)
MILKRPARAAALADDEADLVARIVNDDRAEGGADGGTDGSAAFETLMRRHNGTLFRVARAILKDDAEAEDALQEAYLDAYRHLADFRGGARLGTWLTRLTINRALLRLRKQKRDRVVVSFSDRPDRFSTSSTSDARTVLDMADERIESPPDALLRAEVRALLERRIDALPVAFRTVFVLREVEEMTVDETAACLSIPAATVRTRLFRARALLREALARDIDRATVDVFHFDGERCDRIVARVLAQTHPANRSNRSTR